MVSVLHYLLLLWLSSGGTATGAQETLIQVIKATESHTVFLPCPFDPALTSDYLDLTWVSPSGELLLYTYVRYLQSDARLGDMWGLLLYNTSRQDDVWFICKWNGIWGTNHTLTNKTDLPQDISHPARHPEFFPCDASIPNNWTEASLSWVQHDSLAQETVLMKVEIWHSAHYRVSMRSNAIFLILPSVTSNDTGNYTCQWKDYKHHFQVEVMAKSGAFWLVFGHQHWIIWTVALGYIVVCLSFLFCYLWHRHAICARKKQMKLRSRARRGYFYAKRSKAHGSNGIVASPANQDGPEQVDVFSYENVLPVMVPRRNGRRLLQKGKILPNTINTEDEEEYECPDSETEHKSDDDDNYENTQEEVKQGEMLPKDTSLYENKNSKVKSGSHNWVSADVCYANKDPEAPKILPQDPLDEADGENYENLEEESPMSPGAMRLIAGLRIHLALDPPSDKQDGVSETSTGSQSYEEMNGSLSHTTTKPLHLHPNTSNEEDADSYENMESPNNFNSRQEGNLDPHAEGVAYGSPWQHRSIPFNVDLTGGRLCSE
ncbi:B-lymphocyte antigen CD19 [Sceloporus undulatus]|uniref:B-lymphocyte antigen CD19 n=1 Tax=Sceloporus undulatus TaxID=8520 RepID=UPI001C4D4B6C|nr:B-lymphocyte antigen CD19 [Sceloporus undulatus]